MLHLGGEENNVAELIINSLHSWSRSELKHGAGRAPVYTVIISVNMAAGLCRCSPFHHAAAAAAADGGLQPFLLSELELVQAGSTQRRGEGGERSRPPAPRHGRREAEGRSSGQIRKAWHGSWLLH